MNKQRIAAILMLASILILILSYVIFPLPNLYQEPDIEVRLQIVEDSGSSFANAQITTAVVAAGIAVGYLLLTLELQGDKTAALANLGALLMILAATAVAIYVSLGISDPRAYLDTAARESSSLELYLQGFAWLSIAAYLSYGVVFLRGMFPRWLAFLTLGFTALVTIMVVFVDIFAIEIFFFFMPIVIGLVLLRKGTV